MIILQCEHKAATNLEENIVIVAFVKNVVHGLASIDSLCKKFCLTSFDLLTSNTFLILNLFQTIKFLTLEFIEF